MRERLAVLTNVWHKREYRAVLLIMVFLSLATSSTLPLVTLYLVDRLHVVLSLVGLYFVGEALLGFILGLVVGRWSDRWPSRVPAMRLAATWVAIGWLVFALSPYVWLSLAVGALFVSAGARSRWGRPSALHDVMVRDAERRPGFVNATIRTAFSLGFVLGPLLHPAGDILHCAGHVHRPRSHRTTSRRVNGPGNAIEFHELGAGTGRVGRTRGRVRGAVTPAASGERCGGPALEKPAQT